MNARLELDLTKVREWSLQVQHELSGMLLDLAARWDAVPLALTGDGFLVSLPQVHLDALKSAFRPLLSDQLTVSTGIGPTIKDAYLALKLCKAGNRGGGIYYLMIPPVEEAPWRSLANSKIDSLPSSVWQ